MAWKEVEYIDRQPLDRRVQKPIPFGLRLLAVRAIIEESILHPTITSYISVDVDNNKIKVQRERKNTGPTRKAKA